jgi:inner membrane protein
MLSRTHDIGAFATLLTAAAFYPPSHLGLATVLVALIANIVGALLPDADQASNRLWDLLPAGNYVGKLLRNLFLSHRTLSHSLLGIFIIYKLNYWLIYRLFNPAFVNPQIIFISLMIGYISHLILDSLTEEGVPILFPIKWKFGLPPIRSWRIKTGHWFENWVVFPGIVIYIFWLLYTFWPTYLVVTL